MEQLRRDLDDTDAAPCGRCDVCAGTWFPTEVAESAAATARAAIDRPGVELEPRSTWPTGMPSLGVEVKGRIPADEQAATGRALARLSDVGWGTRLRDVVGPTAGDGPVTERVVAAVVAVLKEWTWDRRPVAVVAMPSRTRPQLVASLAERIATLGKLQPLGAMALAHGGPTGQRGGNSAHRLAAVWDRLVVPADVEAAMAGVDGPVLLVDDLADSRWSLTVAARSLRRAGADEVLPLVLALDA